MKDSESDADSVNNRRRRSSVSKAMKSLVQRKSFARAFSSVKIQTHTDLHTGLPVNYETFHVKPNDLLSLIDKFHKKVKSERDLKDTAESYDDLFDNLKSNIVKSFEFAPKKDFGPIQCNGVRMILNHTKCYFTVAVKKKRASELLDFLEVVKVLDAWFSMVAYLSDLNLTSTNATDHPDVSRHIYRSIYSAFNPIALQTILGPGYHCVVCPGMKFPFAVVERGVIAIAGKGLKTKIKSAAIGRKTIAKTAANVAPGVSVQDSTDVIRFMNNPMMRSTFVMLRAVTSFGRSVDVKVHRMNLPTKFSILIEDNDVVIKPTNNMKENAVKFHVLKYGQDEEFDNKLLFYVHGGAFVGPKASVLNDFFVKEFANNLKGLTILSLDYLPGPEATFPVAPQQVLDTYLWLTSGKQEVKDKIGFHPEEIVLLGDSSGGNLVTQLLVILNELRHMGTGLSPKMPKAAVACWPKSSLQFDIFPSLMSCMFDSLLSMQLLLGACVAYIPMLKRDDNDNWNLVTDNHTIPLDFLLRDDYKVIESPILSPVNYDKMDQLSDVKLNVLALGNDPLLDESLELAKRWKGKTRLLVLEGTAHGGFIFNYFSKVGSRCVLATTEMIKHAFDD
jgi:acetyl esterase/lipase